MNAEKHIIVIDDDPLIHISCEMMLYGSRYRKTSIDDPVKAMLYQQSKDQYDKPDLILVDYMMGHITGIDVIQSIRIDPYFEKIPIIMFTGYSDQIIKEVTLLKKLNIASVLSKPISKAQLLLQLDHYVYG
jgi:CheY-like chemotaxis protein